MKNTEVIQTQEKKWHRVILVLIVGLAAFSSAMKELNQFQALTTEAGQFIAEWVGGFVPTARADALPKAEVCPNEALPQSSARANEFHWNGRVVPGAAIEIKGINGDIVAEPATDGEVQVVAVKKSRRSDVNTVEIKVVEHAGGVTICAIYPNDDSTSPNTCEPGASERGRNSSTNVNVRNNDVRVDFTVRVPRQVGFIARTVNGEIGATSLASNIVSRTVNGSIKISTSGYAEATTINGEISAKLGDTNWPQSLTFTTVNGQIALDLPPDTSTEVKAETLNGSINSDFPLSLRSMTSRRRVSGTIGAGGRELVLKTLNGSINLRRAS